MSFLSIAFRFAWNTWNNYIPKWRFIRRWGWGAGHVSRDLFRSYSAQVISIYITKKDRRNIRGWNFYVWNIKSLWFIAWNCYKNGGGRRNLPEKIHKMAGSIIITFSTFSTSLFSPLKAIVAYGVGAFHFPYFPLKLGWHIPPSCRCDIDKSDKV